MSAFQLPPLKSSEQFEHFVCELFNCMEKTDSYTEFQLFGIRGQDQKGIDIFSQTRRTVIQCKAKDTRGRDEFIRKRLLVDIEGDLAKIRDLRFPFDRMIFASTFRDDVQIQEFLNSLRAEREYSFSVQYIGWDTLSHYAEDHDELLKKYFRQFRQKTVKTQLPDQALGTDLGRKNYVHRLINRYADWWEKQHDRAGIAFNHPGFRKSLMNRYKAIGINHIPLSAFDDLVEYLHKKIDGTAFGRNQRARGRRNYSEFDEPWEEADGGLTLKGSLMLGQPSFEAAKILFPTPSARELKEKAEFKKKRAEWLCSTDGVGDAERSVNEILDAIQQRYDSAAEYKELGVEVKRVSSPCEIKFSLDMARQIFMQIAWAADAINVLDGARLSVRLSRKEPNQRLIYERDYIPTLQRDGGVRWEEKGRTTDALTSDDLAERFWFNFMQEVGGEVE
jgi:hypothetical protein